MNFTKLFVRITNISWAKILLTCLSWYDFNDYNTPFSIFIDTIFFLMFGSLVIRPEIKVITSLILFSSVMRLVKATTILMAVSGLLEKRFLILFKRVRTYASIPFHYSTEDRNYYHISIFDSLLTKSLSREGINLSKFYTMKVLKKRFNLRDFNC